MERNRKDRPLLTLTNLGLTHLPPKSPNFGGLQSSSPQSWGARGAKKTELRQSCNLKTWRQTLGGVGVVAFPTVREAFQTAAAMGEVPVQAAHVG
jgi:hypothetical protein